MVSYIPDLNDCSLPTMTHRKLGKMNYMYSTI